MWGRHQQSRNSKPRLPAWNHPRPPTPPKTHKGGCGASDLAGACLLKWYCTRTHTHTVLHMHATGCPNESIHHAQYHQPSISCAPGAPAMQAMHACYAGHARSAVPRGKLCTISATLEHATALRRRPLQQCPLLVLHQLPDQLLGSRGRVKTPLARHSMHAEPSLLRHLRASPCC
jgi:hypothetical protein